MQNSQWERIVPTIGDLGGLWQRSLIVWPDGHADSTTAVYWLQGPGFYIDLRQPVGRPSFDGVTCLQDLRQSHVTWMATQEGQAGELRFDGTYFEWQRDIDFQPRPIYSDCGRLWFEGTVMIEEGRDIPYIEHWHRTGPQDTPWAALRLQDMRDGRLGFVVRVGELFMYARGRAADLPSDQRLDGCVRAAATLEEAQKLFDIEVSFGNVDARGWRITQSSLPFKEQTMFEPLSLAGDRFRTTDITPEGRPIERLWQITHVQGDLADLATLMTPSPA
jgi:hypothetical protein